MNMHIGSARNKGLSNTVLTNTATTSNVNHANVSPVSKSRSGSQRLARFIAPLMLAAVALPLTAATEFEDSIPIELARVFLGLTGVGDASVYQDILDEFPPFTVPAAFAVLGSIDQVYSQRVVLRTDLDADAAKTSITEAFTTAGWQVMEFSNFRPGQQGGFVSSTQPQVPLQLCHDDYGMLQVSVSTNADGQLVNLSRSPATAMGGGFGMSPCDPARFGPGNMMGPAGRGGIIAHMPTLVVPETPTARNGPRGFFGGGGSGGQDDYETESQLSSDLALPELFAHFATQVVEQGWTTDSESTGSFLATGSFTKTVEGDVELIGVLTVLEVADNGFDLKFRLLRKGRGNATDRVRIMNAPAEGTRELSELRSSVTQGVIMTDAQTGEISTRILRPAETAQQAPMQQAPMRTLSFRIPEFQLEHADDRRYYVVEFNGRSSTVKPGVASSEGVLTASFPDYRGTGLEATQPEAEQHNWFFSVNHYTGQLLFTLDLTDVPLVGLVNSLALALDKGPADEMLQPPSGRGSSGSTPAEAVRLKIRGNHMTLRETFDLIHQQTGCNVFREQGRLLMAVCE